MQQSPPCYSCIARVGVSSHKMGLTLRLVKVGVFFLLLELHVNVEEAESKPTLEKQEIVHKVEKKE
jgi:hypothetical protein